MVRDLLDGFRARVDAQIVIRLVAPLLVGAIVVVTDDGSFHHKMIKAVGGTVITVSPC